MLFESYRYDSQNATKIVCGRTWDFQFSFNKTYFVCIFSVLSFLKDTKMEITETVKKKKDFHFEDTTGTTVYCTYILHKILQVLQVLQSIITGSPSIFSR